jgi:hypothetical protein
MTYPEFVGVYPDKGGPDRQHAEVATQAVLRARRTPSGRENKHLLEGAR